MDIDFPPKMEFLFRPARFKVGYGGRDSGKSWSFGRALLIQGLDEPQKVLCAREIQDSIRDSVHSLLEQQIRALDMGMSYRVLDKEIRGWGNCGTEFAFSGLKHKARDLKSFEGAKKAWVEEANQVSKLSWDTLEPTIRLPGSEIWVSFNPELETDETYKRFVISPPPGAVVVKTTWRDNPWSSDVLAEGREHMRATKPDDYDWIWEGNCRRMMEGSVFAEELRVAESEQRLTQVPYDPAFPVDTFWDLGWGDYTSIWFVQSTPMVFRVVDFYQNHLQKIQHYMQVLQSRGYVYRTHYLPHDAAHEHLTGRTPIEVMRTANFNVEVVPKLSILQGIDAARTIFPKCYFDQAKCADGLQSLRHYRFKKDENTGHFSKEPLHDEYSHAADAFRYLGVGVQGPAQKQQEIKYPSLGNRYNRSGMTPRFTRPHGVH